MKDTRSFKNVWEMNTYMIDMWNKTVKRGDQVFHLGDFGYKVRGGGTPLDKIIKSLNGCITLIRGNHDKYVKKHEHLFHCVKDLHTVKLHNGVKCMLCHYPMRTWNASHWGSYHLHGHAHGGVIPGGKMWDVGVDVNGFRPISEFEVMAIMRDLPDNENLIKNKT